MHSVHVEQCDEMSMRELRFKFGIIVLQYVHRVGVVLRVGLDIVEMVVLPCDAVCCCVLPCDAVCCCVLLWGSVSGSQRSQWFRVAACCSVLQCDTLHHANNV